MHKGPVFRFRPGKRHDLLLREGSMPYGRDALAARFTRAWSAKCGRAPYPDLFEAMGCASPHLSRDCLTVFFVGAARNEYQVLVLA
jgi:hypothetical protein